MLSQDQIETFHKDGVLVVEDIIPPQQIEAVKAEYATRMDTLYADWHEKGWVKSPDGLDFWGKVDQCYVAKEFDWYQPFDITLPHHDIMADTPMHHGPAIFDIVTNDRLLDVVESLIGPELTSNPIQHVRIKPPERLLPKDEVRAHITATDWHQDRGVTLAEADETEMITVWLAITDATVENGCLQAQVGQEEEMLPHCLKTQVGIPDQFLKKSKVRPLPVKAGGAVLFHPLTPHASLSNKTDGYRWSFDLRYNVTGQPTGRSQFPDFVARSRGNPDSELRDWKRWKEMWEEARAHLSSVPHIDQHRWNNSAPYCA